MRSEVVSNFAKMRMIFSARKGRDSSALKVFVMGQKIYIWVMGS